MTEIDFSKIRGGGDAGRRKAFEDFVCQLARRDQSSTDKWEFIPVDGRGGDGGVEAYWLCPDGTKIGYQAKYWLKARDIKWRQVDKSVRKAIQTHPELTRYIIAIPCDLTNKVGKRSGKAGRQVWDERVAKWKSGVVKKKNLEFEFWGESELRDRAINHLSSGAIAYWFDATVLDAGWFKKRSKRAIKELGTRFMPDSNIDTDITRHFAVFLKKDEAFDYLENAITEFVEDWKPYIRRFKSTYPIKSKREKIKELTESISQLEGLFSKDLLRKKGWESIKQELDEIIEKGTFDARDLWEEASRKLDETSDDALKDAKSDLMWLINKLDRLYKIARSKLFQAYDKSVFLLTGSFGTGKSHALGRLLETEVGAETPMVLFLGQQFVKEDPEQQIIDKIGIASLKTFSQFLGALNARAEACGKIGIIAIDAINEGDGLDIWFNYLAGFLDEISNFPSLKLIIACRSEFEAIVPEEVQEIAYDYELWGFSNENEQERAWQLFMDKQGIQRPPSLILLPAFQNPLFLTVACRALKEKGEKRFPDGLTGMVELIRFYLNSVGENVTRHYRLSSNLKVDIIGGIYALAEEMAKRKQPGIPREQAIQILRDKIQTPAPNNTNWLDVLLETGCLRLDPGLLNPSRITQNIVVSFAYQSFGDYLIADALYKSLQGDFDKIFEPDGDLSFMIGDDFFGARNDWVDDDEVDADDTNKVDNYRINTHWYGVFTMLWVIFAEKQKIELSELLPSTVFEDDQHTINEAFVEGLFWRSPASVTRKTTEYRGDFSKSFHLTSHFWAVPNHPWDAFALSKNLKQYPSMAERDAKWTIFVLTNYKNRDPLKRLIEWSLTQKNAPTKEVAIRIMIALGWCLSTTHLKLRDRITKALTHMLRISPELMVELFEEFAEVDDLYIMDRLLASLYGACQFIGTETNKKRYVGELAQIIYDTIFSDGKPPLHLLVRDYAQGIIERADYLNILPSNVDLGKCTPPYKSDYPQEFKDNNPGTLYTNEAIDDLAKFVGDDHEMISRSCTTEYGRGMSAYGDFGRYVLQSHVNSFSRVTIDQPPPEEVEIADGFNGELVGNWVAHRVYEYHGWRKKLFPYESASADRFNNTIERIGKKYQWISMYELLGILADHVYVRGEWADEAKKYTSIEDLSYVRDIDPTISISINQQEISELLHFDATEPFPQEDAEIPKTRDWLFEKEIAVDDLADKIEKTDAKGRRWYMLYGIDSKSISSAKSKQIPCRDFFRLSTNCLPVADMEEFLAKNREGHLSDPRSPTGKEPWELFEGKFLLEMDWRNLSAPSQYDYETLANIPYFQPTYEYNSPEKNDETGRSRSLLPHPRIISRFGLKVDSKYPNLIKNQKGDIVFYTHSRQNEDGSQQVCYIDADLFDEFLRENDLVCVWLLGGERIWMGEMQNEFRCFSSMAWIENNQMKVEHWHRDILHNG